MTRTFMWLAILLACLLVAISAGLSPVADGDLIWLGATALTAIAGVALGAALARQQRHRSRRPR